MSENLDWRPDQQQSRIFWLRHEHFKMAGEYSHITVRLRACYDVVAAPGWRIATHRQPWNEIWLVQNGSVELIQDDNKTVAQSGDVAILTAGRSRISRENRDKPLSLIGFSFEAMLWNSVNLLDAVGAPLVVRPSTQWHERIEYSIRSLIEECRSGHALSTLSAQSHAQLAVADTLRASFSGQELQEIWQERIPAALGPDIAESLRFIGSHLGTSLHLDDLAKTVHLSPKHFARKFKAALGVAPMEYLRRARFERAQGLLIGSDESVGNIAAQCGFDDPAHFSRAFKKFAGFSPLEFRKHARVFYPESRHSNPSS